MLGHYTIKGLLPTWGNMYVLALVIVHYSPLLLSCTYYFQHCGLSLSSDDKCIVIAVACFNLLPRDGIPACLTKTDLWMDDANIPKSLRDYTIKADHSGSHGVLLDFLRLFCYQQTQSTVLSGGALVGWHWEHLWVKGKSKGGRTEDIDRRRTNTLLCPSTADGEGQICSMFPGKPVDETKCCRKEHRKAIGLAL